MAQAASVKFSRSNSNEAERHLPRAVEIWRQTPVADRNDAHLANAISSLGRLRTRQKRYAQSETLLTGARDLDFDLHGEHHPHYGARLRHLGEVYALQGRKTEAFSMLRQALIIQRQNFLDSHAVIKDLLALMTHYGCDTDDLVTT